MSFWCLFEWLGSLLYSLVCFDLIDLKVKIKVFRGHTDAVNSCNYIDNDTKILTGSSDKTSRIWDVDTGELKHHYTGGHEAAISETSINDNSRR
jgi:WD40 repeat protein